MKKQWSTQEEADFYKFVRLWNRCCNDEFTESSYGMGIQKDPSYFGGVVEGHGLTSMLESNFYAKDKSEHQKIAEFLRKWADAITKET